MPDNRICTWRNLIHAVIPSLPVCRLKTFISGSGACNSWKLILKPYYILLHCCTLVLVNYIGMNIKDDIGHIMAHSSAHPPPYVWIWIKEMHSLIDVVQMHTYIFFSFSPSFFYLPY